MNIYKNYYLHGMCVDPGIIYFGSISNEDPKASYLRFIHLDKSHAGAIEYDASGFGEYSFSHNDDRCLYLVYRTGVVIIDKAKSELLYVTNLSSIVPNFSKGGLAYIGPGSDGPLFSFLGGSYTCELLNSRTSYEIKEMEPDLIYHDRLGDASVYAISDVKSAPSYVTFSRNPPVFVVFKVVIQGVEKWFHSHLIGISVQNKSLYFQDLDRIIEVDFNTLQILQTLALPKPVCYYTVQFGTMNWINDHVFYIRMGMKAILINLKIGLVRYIENVVMNVATYTNRGVFIISSKDNVWDLLDLNGDIDSTYDAKFKELNSGDHMMSKIHL